LQAVGTVAADFGAGTGDFTMEDGRDLILDEEYRGAPKTTAKAESVRSGNVRLGTGWPIPIVSYYDIY